MLVLNNLSVNIMEIEIAFTTRGFRSLQVYIYYILGKKLCVCVKCVCVCLCERVCVCVPRVRLCV